MKLPPKVKSKSTISAVDVTLSAIATAYLDVIWVVKEVKTGITPSGFTIVNNDVKASKENCKSESIFDSF